MLVAGPPNQMRPQGASEQAAGICRQNFLFGQCLRVRIVSEPAVCIRHRFVDIALIIAIKRHTRTARKDESGHSVFLTALNDVARSERVGFIKVPPRAPKAGNGSRVIDDVDTVARRCDSVRTADIAANDFYAQAR